MYEKFVLKLKVYQIAFLLFMLGKVKKKPAVLYLYSSDKIIILGNSSSFFRTLVRTDYIGYEMILGKK